MMLGGDERSSVLSILATPMKSTGGYTAAHFIGVAKFV